MDDLDAILDAEYDRQVGTATADPLDAALDAEIDRQTAPDPWVARQTARMNDPVEAYVRAHGAPQAPPAASAAAQVAGTPAGFNTVTTPQAITPLPDNALHRSTAGNLGAGLVQGFAGAVPPGIVPGVNLDEWKRNKAFEGISSPPEGFAGAAGSAVGGMAGSLLDPSQGGPLMVMEVAGAEAARIAAPVLERIAVSAGPKVANLAEHVIKSGVGAASVGMAQKAAEIGDGWVTDPLGSLWEVAKTGGVDLGVFGAVGGVMGRTNKAGPGLLDNAREAQATPGTREVYTEPPLPKDAAQARQALQPGVPERYTLDDASKRAAAEFFRPETAESPAQAPAPEPRPGMAAALGDMPSRGWQVRAGEFDQPRRGRKSAAEPQVADAPVAVLNGAEAAQVLPKGGDVNRGQSGAEVHAPDGIRTIRESAGDPVPGSLGKAPDEGYQFQARTLPKMYREMSLYHAITFFPEPVGVHVQNQPKLYFSNHPDLALGQGENKGVLIEIDPAGMAGIADLTKPTSRHVWENGVGEFLLDGTTKDYISAIRAIDVAPDAQKGNEWGRLKIWSKALVDKGWTVATAKDGTVMFRPPNRENPAAKVAPATPPGEADGVAPESPKTPGGINTPKPPDVGEPRPRATTATKNAAMAEDREALGLGRVNSPERFTDKQAIDEARSSGMAEPDKANRLAAEIIARPRTIEKVEDAALRIHAVRLKNEAKPLREKMVAATDKAEIMDLAAQLGRIQDEFDAISTATKLGGTEWGRAGQSRKIEMNEDFDIVAVKSQFKARKGAPLTKAENAMLEARVKELEALNKQQEAHIKKQDEARAQDMIQHAKSKRPPRNKTIREDRVTLEAKLRELISKGCQTT